MIKLSAEFDFTRIRHYHPLVDMLASSLEKRGEPINSINQDFYIDVASKGEYDKFLSEYEALLKFNNLQDEIALDLLFLTQQTYSDIEIAQEVNDELLETDVNLRFLIDALFLQEKGNKRKSNNNRPTAGLSLTVNSIDGSATLKNSIVIDYVINQIIKVFKDKSYNSQLSARLENTEITSTNLKVIYQALKYRTSDAARYCTAETASSILKYLNELTLFKSESGGITNRQARFIFDLLQLFNLLKNIINIKDIPRLDKSKIDTYKTVIIKTLIKNHQLLNR